jgi:hypothetical protein
MADRARDRPTAPQRGARSPRDGDDRPKKKKGLLWLLLGLLALAVLAIVLALLLSGDDKEEQASQPAPPPGQAQSQSQPPPAGGAASDARLLAGGKPVTPNPEGGLSVPPGQDAEGQGVTVQAVVKDEGFWVGKSAQDRVYVEYGGDVGAAETSSKYVPKVGQKVNVSGPLKPAPQDPEQVLNLTGPDAAQVREQGAYVNAETVKEVR